MIQKNNNIIVNGIFDLFHDGHKYLLEHAAHFTSSHVILLLNSDASARRLKGEGRPIDDFDTRCSNVRRFWLLHFRHSQDPDIIVSSIDTEEELQEKIDFWGPKLILKGNDRTDVKNIVGSNRWPVCILPRLIDTHGNDISTTNLTKEKQKSE